MHFILNYKLISVSEMPYGRLIVKQFNALIERAVSIKDLKLINGLNEACAEYMSVSIFSLPSLSLTRYDKSIDESLKMV